MKNFVLFMLLFFISSIFYATAQSLTVQEAKRRGLVGETFSGYLAPVKTDQVTVAFVKQINLARQQKYQEIAVQNGINRENVAQMAGQKLVARALSGEYVQGINGKWQQLP